MKKMISLCLAALLTLGASTSALADRGRHEGYRHHNHHNHHQHNSHHYRSGSNWAGPAALLAITGLAVGAAAYSSQVHSTPVYVAPPPRPVQVLPDSGNWYYCGSSGQYYPYVRHCPEGWQEVMPPR